MANSEEPKPQTGSLQIKSVVVPQSLPPDRAAARDLAAKARRAQPRKPTPQEESWWLESPDTLSLHTSSPERTPRPDASSGCSSTCRSERNELRERMAVVEAKLAALQDRLPPAQDPPKRSRTRRRSAAKQQRAVSSSVTSAGSTKPNTCQCYYHRKFGEHANKCECKH